VRQSSKSSGAFDSPRLGKAPEDWRSPKRCREPFGFLELRAQIATFSVLWTHSRIAGVYPPYPVFHFLFVPPCPFSFAHGAYMSGTKFFLWTTVYDREAVPQNKNNSL
jgi:hypothetical protein